MPASVVVGQPDFTSNAANQGSTAKANTLNSPRYAMIAENKLLVLDSSNNRVLIWNKIPTENNTPADVVIGQNSMTASTSLGCTANGLQPVDGGLLYVKGKLFVTDASRNRVLVFNGIPTSNGASANYVIGQNSLTSCSVNAGGSQSAVGINQGAQLASDGEKLALADNANNRILIYNTIPQSSGTAADVVLGSNTFTSTDTGVTARTFSSPRGLAFWQGKLIVGDRGNFRTLIFDDLRTGASASVVLGQSSFTANTSSPPATASSMHPFYLHVDGKGRLYISDRNSSRYLIFNQVPTTNNKAADIVIGQPDFTSSTSNNGGVSAQSTHTAKGIWADDRYMVISEPENHRVLIYDNQIENPGISVSNTESRPDNYTRFNGTARTNSPYTIASVEYALNGQGFQSTTAKDDSFNATSEDFYFDARLADFPLKDEFGQLIDGYTLQLKAKNTNADQTEHAFAFSPFVLNGPADGESVDTSFPTFDFSVNKQRLILRDNLSHFAIQVKNRSQGGDWQTLIDQIPVDFASRKNDQENLQHVLWQSLDVQEGQYETDTFIASYADQGSRIIVRSKTQALSGTYEWRAVAVDKSGHSQETGARSLIVGGTMGSVTPGFPLAILNISGLGNPNISSYNLTGIKKAYLTSSAAPTFYGIAWSGATVKLQLKESNCTANCTQEFSTTANELSRFGINVPVQALKRSTTYSVTLSAHWNDFLTQLPTFLLKIQ